MRNPLKLALKKFRNLISDSGHLEILIHYCLLLSISPLPKIDDPGHLHHAPKLGVFLLSTNHLEGFRHGGGALLQTAFLGIDSISSTEDEEFDGT